MTYLANAQTAWPAQALLQMHCNPQIVMHVTADCWLHGNPAQSVQSPCLLAQQHLHTPMDS